MAVFSVTSHAKLGRYKTLAAEYYQPRFMDAEQMLNSLGRQCAPLKTCVQSQYPITYGVLKPREVESSTYRLARIQNSESLFVFGDDLPPISGIQFEEYGRSEVRTGDLIVAIGGYIGPLGIISDSAGCRLNINRHLARVSPDATFVDGYYLAAYLASRVSQTLLIREVRGAVQAGINIADVKLHPVFLPTKEDQIAIGNLMRAAEKLHKASRLSYFSAQECLETELGLDKLTFQKPVGYIAQLSDIEISRRFDPEHYFPAFSAFCDGLPSRVKLSPLSNHLDFCQRGKQPIYARTGLPVINSKHVEKNRVIREGNRFALANPVADLQIRYGDTLINGTGRGTIGRTAPYLSHAFAVADNHVTILRSKNLDPAYLSVYLNSAAGQMQVEMYQRGSSGQLELYPFDIRKLLVWDAPPELQRELRDLHDATAAAEQESHQLLEQAKARVEQLIDAAVLR